jgi:hypothetical protein
MQTLMIKDLPVAEELDRKAMSAVRGGSYKFAPSWLSYYSSDYDLNASKHDFSIDVSQLVGQTQTVNTTVGNNVAFAQDIHATVKPTQTATNNNTIRF